MSAKKPQLIAVSAYGRLRGIDQKTIRKTLDKVGWVGKVDVEKVDRLIAEAKDIRYKPGLTTKGALISYGEAQRRERLAKARIIELKLLKIEGTLVDKAVVEKRFYELIRNSRDKLFNIPARSSGILAAESDQAEVFRILTEEIQSALEELSA